MGLETGVGWVRWDASIYRNPKVLGLLGLPAGHKTFVAYAFSFAYAGENGCTGIIPKLALPVLQATTKDAQRLVQADLWEPVKDGWYIHDWHVYQPTPEYVAKLSKAGKDGAKARWEKYRAKTSATSDPAQDSPGPPPI